MPQNWLDLARGAREAANRLLTEDLYRSAVARAYDAAYSKITHELTAIAGLPMSPGREEPGHNRIRPVIAQANGRAKLGDFPSVDALQRAFFQFGLAPPGIAAPAPATGPPPR